MDELFIVVDGAFTVASGPFSSRDAALEFVGDMMKGVGVFGVEFYVVPLVSGGEEVDDDPALRISPVVWDRED